MKQKKGHEKTMMSKKKYQDIEDDDD